MCQDIYKYIPFVNKYDKVEKILKGGHSPASLYKIIREDKEFFLKIFDEEYNEKHILKIRQGLEIYKRLDINSLEIIDYGKIKENNKYYIVYNFIQGENLKTYTNLAEFTLQDIRKLGEKIGKELLKLENYKDFNKEVFKQPNLDIQTKEVIDNFYSMMEDKESKLMITKFFDLKEIEELRNQLNRYALLVKKEKPKLIHGDIKRANIMIDNNKKIHIIDIESIQRNYEIMNFKYQMTYTLFEGNEREKEFVSGYFDGIYDNSRPANFNYKIIYIIILNFFNASYNMYKKCQKDKLFAYLNKSRNLFNKINSIDLTKDILI